jgi:hypothetical protein
MKYFGDTQSTERKERVIPEFRNYYRSHPYDFTTCEHPDTARLNFGRSKSFPQTFDEHEIELIIFEKNLVPRGSHGYLFQRLREQAPTLQIRRVSNLVLSRPNDTHLLGN